MRTSGDTFIVIRLTASIVAISFFLQQGNCCSGETVCNVWLSAISQDHDCCERHHHEHDDDAEHEHSTPADSQHSHHFCVGTHLFYLDTAGDFVPLTSMVIAWEIPTFIGIDVRLFSSSKVSRAASPEHADPIPTLPLRAEQPVFLI